MSQITVVRARLVDGVPTPKTGGRLGFGRDADEARAHAGWAEQPSEGELIDEVTLFDNPKPDDTLSELAGNEVCRFHVEDDDDLPDDVKAELKALLDQRRYASAFEYCFETVWDRGFEEAD